MKPAPGPAKEAPHLLALFLILAGGGCLTLAAGLTTVDLASLVSRQIAAARGVISGETLAWLRATPFRSRLLEAGALLLLLGAGIRVRRPALRNFLARVSTWKILQRHWVMPTMAGLGVLIWFFPTLWSGYFRYDDFDFLVAAKYGSFWETLWRPHGDHFLPIMRLLAWLAFECFGVTAWPYNAWILTCMTGVLAIGVLLLRELNVSWPGQLVFVALVIFWSPWAEMMTGYYVLSMYFLIALLSMAAIWFCLRWMGKTNPVDALGAAICLFLAPLVDISGCYVIGACGVFLAVNFLTRAPGTVPRTWLVRHRALLAGLTLAAVTGLAANYYDYRVLHPGVFLHMSEVGQRTVWQRMGDFAYLFDAGVLGSMVTPFVYARLPPALLGVVLVGVSLTWVVFSTLAVRAAEKPRRASMAAIFLVVVGTALMVTLGRPPSDTMIVRWAAKHVCPVYLWLCLLLAVSWDALWLRMQGTRRAYFAELTAIALAVFVVAQGAFGLLGMAVAFPPFGYPAEIRDAGRRREAVDVLRREVFVKITALANGPVAVPTLDGAYIKAVYPSLFDYNLSNYLPFFSNRPGNFRFVRNSAMQPDFSGTVQTVPVLRDAVTPSFLELLARDPGLRAFYAREVPLRATTPGSPIQPLPRFGRAVPGGGTARPDNTGGTIIESDGAIEIVLRDQRWDPETASRLRILAQRLDSPAAQEFPVTVIFASELLHADWRGSLSLPAGREVITEVDLRQVYAFSLSPQVAHLRIVLTQPGRYCIRLAELVP